MGPYLEKPFTKIGLVEWVKVKALSSSPSMTKKKKAINCDELLRMRCLSMNAICTSSLGNTSDV
jgi:hypothetical protein